MTDIKDEIHDITHSLRFYFFFPKYFSDLLDIKYFCFDFHKEIICNIYFCLLFFESRSWILPSEEKISAEMTSLSLIIDETNHHLVEGLYLDISSEVFETIGR